MPVPKRKLNHRKQSSRSSPSTRRSKKTARSKSRSSGKSQAPVTPQPVEDLAAVEVSEQAWVWDEDRGLVSREVEQAARDELDEREELEEAQEAWELARGGEVESLKVQTAWHDLWGCMSWLCRHPLSRVETKFDPLTRVITLIAAFDPIK